MSNFRNQLKLSSTASKRPPTADVLDCITKLSGGTTGWFISGSYANKGIESPKDIDVYFENTTILCNTIDNIKSSSYDINSIVENSLSFSFSHKDLPLRIQLIKKIGTPLEVLERFDLNVCKKVLFSNGTYWEHPDSLYPLSILKFNYDTVNRFFKYHRRLYPESTEKEVVDISKRLIDTFIGNNSLVIDEYLDSSKVSTVNNQIFEYFIHDTAIKPYLIEAALRHSPDLLI